VEVLHDRGPAPPADMDRWTGGSGYLIGGRLVLTAAHNVDCRQVLGEDEQLLIRTIKGSELTARVVQVCDEQSGVDLALLEITDPRSGDHLPPVTFARIDRDNPAPVAGCWAVGFPRFGEAGPVLPGGSRRETWQVRGEILPGGKLRAGLLALQVTSTPQPLPTSLAGSAWEGMSGAVVFASDPHDGEQAVGVVSTHHRPEGESALTVVPVTAVAGLRPELQQIFWQALGVTDPAELLALPDDKSQASMRDSSDATSQHDNLRRICDYLGAARVLAEQHPYAFTLQGMPDLPSVYLHQKVSPRSGQGQPDIAELGPVKSVQPYSGEIGITEQANRHLLARAAGQSAIQIAGALQRFTIQDILNQHRGAVLVGGPGTGKSSLLRHLLHEFPTSFPSGNSTPFVPVLVQARAIIGDRPLPDAIAQAVRADLGPLLSDCDLAGVFAEQPLPGVPWLVLLDGIDEIMDPGDRRNALTAVAHWWGNRRYRFLVTSRMLPSAEFQPLDKVDAPFFEIQQFNEDELPGFARRWFVGLGESEVPDLVDDFMSQLRQNRLMQLARNPLIATMMCMMFASDRERILPRSRADLYEQFVTELMNKAISQGNELERLQKRLSPYGSLSQVAVDRVLRGARRLMEDLADRRLATSTEESLIECAASLPAAERPDNVPVPVWRGVLEEVIRQSGVILMRDNDFLFMHHTVMEYLSACKLASPKAPDWMHKWRLGVPVYNWMHKWRLRVSIYKWRLRVSAGRGDSRALFIVSVMYRNGIDLIGRTPKVLALRRLVHARLVASLSHEGLQLSSGTVSLACERLASFASQRRNCIPYIVRDHVWDLEDDCVLAARSLVLLDENRGLAALARAAADPIVGGFNVSRFSELVDLERERWLPILAGLSSSPEMGGFDRAGVALYLLDESRDLGLQICEKLTLDDSVEDVFRVELASKLLEFDRDRGARALTCLIADPLMTQYREECEALLAEIDTRRSATAMAELITKTETVPIDRFGTVMRLISRDRNLALSGLEEISANPEISGFARAGAAVVLYERSPSAGMRALRAFSADEDAPSFHRIFCLEWSWRTSRERDLLFELLKLASTRSMSGQWRVFAAEQLAEIDPDLGLQALAEIRKDGAVRRSWRRRARIMEAMLPMLRRNPARLTSSDVDGEAPRGVMIEASVPSGVQVTRGQNHTQRQLARMKRAGYRALHSDPIPGSRQFIDHFVVGPTGVYVIVCESWDKQLPVRTERAMQLWNGPFDKTGELEHARREAKQASDRLTCALGSEISVRPAMAIYGPRIPWNVATIRDVDVFSGARLRKYLRQIKDRPKLSAAEIERAYAAAARLLPLSGDSRRTP
jgi:Trypsin-like peptidase domain/Nuclease-related domain